MQTIKIRNLEGIYAKDYKYNHGSYMHCGQRQQLLIKINYKLKFNSFFKAVFTLIAQTVLKGKFKRKLFVSLIVTFLNLRVVVPNVPN